MDVLVDLKLKKNHKKAGESLQIFSRIITIIIYAKIHSLNAVNAIIYLRGFTFS